jgi:predicted nucleic acid-binding Zn ribbon protein
VTDHEPEMQDVVDRGAGDPPQPASRKAPPPGPAHDPAGLDLARSVARSVGTRRRRRTPAKGTPADPQVSGARPDDRDPKLLSDAVEDLVRAKGWSTDLNVHTLMARWPLLVGPVNAAHSRPEAYADAVLTVRTDSTAWATQLRMMAPQLVALLNEHLGDGIITRVAILGPDAPSWKKGRRTVRDGRGPRDTYG